MNWMHLALILIGLGLAVFIWIVVMLKIMGEALDWDLGRGREKLK